MTANQIMIPLAGLLLVAWLAYLILRARRISQAGAQRGHRPNAPRSRHDKDVLAKQAAENAGRSGLNGGGH